MNVTELVRTDAHVKKWGGFNDAPPNLREITAKEFAQSGFFTWTIIGIEYRQITSEQFNKGNIFKPVNTIVPCHLFFLNSAYDSGFIILNDYWGKTIRYFKFAECVHDYKEITAAEAGKRAFNCYHYYRCTICGQQNEVDSSD